MEDKNLWSIAWTCWREPSRYCRMFLGCFGFFFFSYLFFCLLSRKKFCQNLWCKTRWWRLTKKKTNQIKMKLETWWERKKEKGKRKTWWLRKSIEPNISLSRSKNEENLSPPSRNRKWYPWDLLAILQCTLEDAIVNDLILGNHQQDQKYDILH